MKQFHDAKAKKKKLLYWSNMKFSNRVGRVAFFFFFFFFMIGPYFMMTFAIPAHINHTHITKWDF